MVKTRHVVDTTSPRAESSSKNSRSSKKRRREGTIPKANSSKKRKAAAEPQPDPEGLLEDEANLEDELEDDFHDETLLPAFEEAALAFQSIQDHIQNADYTDEDDSVLEVPLKLQSPTQTVDIIATPSTRKETTAEPDGEEGEATEYFTPHTSKKNERERPAASTTPKTGSNNKTPTAQSKHLRFRSASPAPEDLLDAEPTLSLEDSDNEDTDSDDDAAPEELAVADAQTQSKLKSAETIKRRNTKAKARRARRRSRKAAKLKEEEASPELSEAGSAPEDTATETALDPNNLPEFLPDHILNSEPPLQSDTKKRARPNVHARKRQKLRANGEIHVPEEKRAKDVQRGPVSVRVLEEQNKMLTPKVVSGTKHVRDGWLKGRQNVGRGQGKKGRTRVERKAFGAKEFV